MRKILMMSWLVVVGVVAALTLQTVTEPEEVKAGDFYSTTFWWRDTAETIGEGINVKDTVGDPTGAGIKPVRVDWIRHRGTIYGAVSIEYTKDTGVSAADTLTSATDTVLFNIWTADETFQLRRKAYTSAKYLPTVPIAQDSGAFVTFNLSDSLLYSNIWFVFESWVNDSDATLHNLGKGIQYQAEIKLWGK